MVTDRHFCGDMYIVYNHSYTQIQSVNAKISVMSDIENIDPFLDVVSNTKNDSEEELEQALETEHRETRPARPTVAINYQYNPHHCCQIDKDIHAERTVILITNAQKTSDDSGSSFITYTIRVGVCNHSYLIQTLRKSLPFLLV
jgi:hypothetical protein